jgi:glutathione S-transferase
MLRWSTNFGKWALISFRRDERCRRTAARGRRRGTRSAYLNWLYFGEATLTFPQALVLRYSKFEPEERRSPQVAADYAKWFFGRLRAVEAAVAGSETLCAGRFMVADISVGYALLLADRIGLGRDFGPAVAAYWRRLRERDGFCRALQAEAVAGEQQNAASHWW